MTLALALGAGALIGHSLGTLGGGGSILAVPLLVHLGQDAGQATTGSLVVVSVTSLVGAVTARRSGHVDLGRGLVVGGVAIVVTSLAALAVRAGGTSPDWSLVVGLTLAAAIGGMAGSWLADRLDADKLARTFTLLVLGVGAHTAVQTVPALV